LNLMVLAPLTAFQTGTACVAVDRIDPVGLAEWVERERIGHFAAVPTIMHDLLTSPDVRQESLSSLVRPMVGGADCPEELRALIRDRFGMEVGIGYGMTEAPTAVTSSGGAPATKPGLCGTALPQVEIRIRDDDGRDLAAGELGEICVAPATAGEWAGVYTPMLGYWNKPEATEKALQGGVYHTGDVGFLEPDGTLYIRGRRNELILRGGANVYPAEVERVLGGHEAVAAAAVLGLPDARLGERVVAVVELEPGRQVEPEELVAYCRDRLARYKTPDTIRTTDGMPRNAMNKIVKPRLRELFD
jgi:long-chain acyl-CoA synthetase